MSDLPTSPIVGKNLKRHREAAHLSADEAAQRLSDALGKEVQPYIINRMEKGSRPITVDEAEALAEVYGVKPGSLFAAHDEVEAAVQRITKIRRENAALVTRLKENVDEILDNNDQVELLTAGGVGAAAIERDPWLGRPTDPLVAAQDAVDEHRVRWTMEAYGAKEVLKSLESRPPEWPF